MKKSKLKKQVEILRKTIQCLNEDIETLLGDNEESKSVIKFNKEVEKRILKEVNCYPDYRVKGIITTTMPQKPNQDKP